MKAWKDFATQSPELAGTGKALLFRERTGLAFLATLRRDGAPRLHPVSLVIYDGRLFVLIPPASPKCADLILDGRYALQAFPTQDGVNEEFYLSGRAECIHDDEFRQAMIEETSILAGEDEVLFELLLERAMHTRLVNCGTPKERPLHKKWRAV